MLAVVRGLDSYDTKTVFSTWLYRITSKAALVKMRSERRRRSTSLDDVYEDPPPVVTNQPQREIDSDPSGLPFKLGAHLSRAIAELPQGYREVVIEHFIEGKLIATVSSSHNVTEAAIRSRLHRARAALRCMLANMCGFSDAADRPARQNSTPNVNATEAAQIVERYAQRGFVPAREDLEADAKHLGMSSDALSSRIRRRLNKVRDPLAIIKPVPQEPVQIVTATEAAQIIDGHVQRGFVPSLGDLEVDARRIGITPDALHSRIYRRVKRKQHEK
jgi:RNA polymerase sigma-70 factor (ECF subfamily)